MTPEEKAREAALRAVGGHPDALATVDGWAELVERVATALRECRREALEEAARAMCAMCRSGNQPRRYDSAGWYHLLGNGDALECRAHAIRSLTDEETE